MVTFTIELMGMVFGSLPVKYGHRGSLALSEGNMFWAMYTKLRDKIERRLSTRDNDTRLSQLQSTL